MYEHVDRFGHDGWWWWTGTLLPFLFFLILIGVGIWAIVRFTSRVPAPAGPALPTHADQALAEVRLRYARGEIDREEFVRRSHDLGGSVPPAEPPPAPPRAAESPPEGGPPGP
jgi:uncharacterized membrane protein